MAPDLNEELTAAESQKLALEREKFEWEKSKYDSESKKRLLEVEKLEREMRVLKRIAFLQPGYLALAVTLVAALGGIYVAYHSDYYRLLDKESKSLKDEVTAKTNKLNELSSTITQKEAVAERQTRAVTDQAVKITQQTSELTSLEQKETAAKKSFDRMETSSYANAASALRILQRINNDSVQPQHMVELRDIVRSTKWMSDRSGRELLGQVANLAEVPADGDLANFPADRMIPLLAAAALCESPKGDKYHVKIVEFLTNENTRASNVLLQHRMIGSVMQYASFSLDEAARFNKLLAKRGLRQ